MVNKQWWTVSHLPSGFRPLVIFFSGEGFPFKLNQTKKDARIFPTAAGHLSFALLPFLAGFGIAPFHSGALDRE